MLRWERLVVLRILHETTGAFVEVDAVGHPKQAHSTSDARNGFRGMHTGVMLLSRFVRRLQLPNVTISLRVATTWGQCVAS